MVSWYNMTTNMNALAVLVTPQSVTTKKGPSMYLNLTTDDLFRFWSCVDQSNRSGCWLWTGSRHPQKGYGLFSLHGRQYYAHRVSFAVANNLEVLDSKVFIRHQCDIYACVRPHHLLSGSHQDNMSDVVRRNRQMWEQENIEVLTTGIPYVETVRRKIEQVTPEERLQVRRRYYQHFQRKTLIAHEMRMDLGLVREICRWPTWNPMRERE